MNHTGGLQMYQSSGNLGTFVCVGESIDDKEDWTNIIEEVYKYIKLLEYFIYHIRKPPNLC
jgi:hypothetical protein